MKRVLITGATGFVGRNLMPYLEQKGISTEALRIRSNQPINGKISAEIDIIIHLAGKAHDLKKNLNPAEYYDVNLGLTRILYDEFLRSNAKKFIFISSVKASRDIVNTVLKEDDNPEPKTDYGKSKLMAEQYIQSQPLPNGKYYYILRPCMIHGPGNKGNLNLLYNFVRRGMPYPLAAFDNKRSFLSVENLCFVIANIIRKDVSSGIYQICDDEALSTNEVVKILASSFGKRARLLAISSKFIYRLAILGDIFNLPLNTERLMKLTGNYIVSNKKIKSALEVDLPLTAREGLLRTADSFIKL
jgi:nucleoside-diphosphate-sugar epimerase